MTPRPSRNILTHESEPMIMKTQNGTGRTEAERLTLFVVRDAADGTILDISLERDTAEAWTVNYRGSYSMPDGRDGPKVPTRPVLETHLVTLGDMAAPPIAATALRPRVRQRERRARIAWEKTVAWIEGKRGKPATAAAE